MRGVTKGTSDTADPFDADDPFNGADPFNADDPFNALVSVDREALARAGAPVTPPDPSRPLAGVAVAVKDNIDVAGLVTGNGSALFADHPPAAADAEVVARLRAGGAEIVAKTHLTELACGTSGLNPHLGDACNPRNPAHHPGGSSSGSAIAVAAGYVPLAVGSDTGGSIRVPAAACGVVGLKPTFGRVSMSGIAPCIAALDHVGPIAANATMAAHALYVMQADGWNDPRERSEAAASLTVGVLTGPFIDACAPDVVANFERSVDALIALGCSIAEVDLTAELAAADDVADALGRTFFTAYGDLVSSAPANLVSDELRMWTDRYGTVGADDYEAACNDQLRLRSAVAHRQAGVHVLVCPTMRATPGPLANAASEPRADRTGNLGLFNVTGQPSLTLPNGPGRNGLPTGLLLTAQLGRDDHVLSLAQTLEQMTER